MVQFLLSMQGASRDCERQQGFPVEERRSRDPVDLDGRFQGHEEALAREIGESYELARGF